MNKKTITTLVTTFLLFFGPSIMTVIAFREYKRSMEKKIDAYVQETNDKLDYLEKRLDFLERQHRQLETISDENFTTIKDELDSLKWDRRIHGR